MSFAGSTGTVATTPISSRNSCFFTSLAAPDFLAGSCNNMGGYFPFPFIFLVMELLRWPTGEVERGLVKERVLRAMGERERDWDRDWEEGSPRNATVGGDKGPDTELTIGDRLIIVSMVCE